LSSILRAHNERPSRCRAARERGEFAPPRRLPKARTKERSGTEWHAGGGANTVSLWQMSLWISND